MNIGVENSGETVKFEGLSTSARRSYKASKHIPLYAARLMRQIENGNPISIRQAELMYRECRQFFKSLRPFRTNPMEARVQDDWAGYPDTQLLEQLLNPKELEKHEAHDIVHALWVNAYERGYDTSLVAP